MSQVALINLEAPNWNRAKRAGPGLWVSLDPTLPAESVSLYAELVSAARQFVRFDHAVEVAVVNGGWTRDEHGCEQFGVYWEPDQTIVLAGLVVSKAIDRRPAIFFHEIGHYIQFRDGLKIQERGVNRIARQLGRAAGYEVDAVWSFIL